jgi:hypothetical protein
VSPASARLDVAASAEAALGGRIDPATAPGARHLVLEVTDSAGRQTTASLPIDVLAVELADDDAPIRLLDTAGRARSSFHWSEDLTVLARVEGGTRARLRMWDETAGTPGREVAGVADLPVVDGAVAQRIVIPRLAPSGSYAIEVDTDSGARARIVFHVRGQTFEPIAELAIDRLVLRGGIDGRAPRAGVIRRGERLSIEARVAGASGELGATLRARRGQWLHQEAWAPTHPAASGPTRRVLVTGTWDVPRELPAGRVQLEIEVTEGEHVSAIHRELLVR